MSSRLLRSGATVAALSAAILLQAQRTLYWTGASGHWNDAAHWSPGPDGPGGAGVPRTGDAVVIAAPHGAVQVFITDDAACGDLRGDLAQRGDRGRGGAPPSGGRGRRSVTGARQDDGGLEAITARLRDVAWGSALDWHDDARTWLFAHYERLRALGPSDAWYGRADTRLGRGHIHEEDDARIAASVASIREAAHVRGEKIEATTRDLLPHILGWALAAAVAGNALAQSAGGDFSITRQVVAGGGASAQGGDFGVAATAAQATAGTSSGGEYTLIGGFHVPVARGDPLFSDGFEGVLP